MQKCQNLTVQAFKLTLNKLTVILNGVRKLFSVHNRIKAGDQFQLL